MKHNLPNILFVIVLYNQRLEICNTYKTLLNNIITPPIFVFDNSPIEQHKKTEFDNSNIHYISDPSNPGLSYAYNRAAEYAKEYGFEWMLLLDQDTIFPLGILDDYLNALYTNPNIKLFAPRIEIQNGKYMSPIKINQHFNCKGVNICNQILTPKKYSVINSGMLISIDAYHNVGGYDNALWLDYSDYLFIERFSKKYNDIYIIAKSCYQEFSNDIHTPIQKLERFAIFCQCVKRYPKNRLYYKIIFNILILKRALSISLFAKNLKAFKIAYIQYFNNASNV